MAEFSFGFTEGSFLHLDGQKHLKSIAEDLINNKRRRANEFIKNREGTDIIKLFNATLYYDWLPFSSGYESADCSM